MSTPARRAASNAKWKPFSGQMRPKDTTKLRFPDCPPRRVTSTPFGIGSSNAALLGQAEFWDWDTQFIQKTCLRDWKIDFGYQSGGRCRVANRGVLASGRYV